MQDLQGELLCAAANSNAIYLAARDESRNTLVLAKTTSSTTPPVDITATTWEVVTARPLDELWHLSYVFECTVNDQGAFMMLSPYTTSTADISDPKYRGVIFDPAKLSPGGMPATWQRVDSDSDFGCTPDCDAIPYSVQQPSSSSFVIASKAVYRADAISFLPFDLTTSSFSKTQTTALFTGAPDALIHGPNSLTIVRMPSVNDDNSTDTGLLKTYMLNNDGFPTGQESNVDLTAANTDCRALQWQAGSFHNGVLYYFCESIDTPQISLYTFDGQTFTKTGSATPLQDVNFLETAYLPFPVSGSGTPTWAFRHDISGMFGISISGPTAGQWQNTNGTALRVDPNYAVVSYPNPLPSSTTDNSPNNGEDESGGSGSHVSGGAIAGIVVAFVVVVGAAFGLLFVRNRRRRRRQERRQQEQEFHQRLSQQVAREPSPSPGWYHTPADSSDTVKFDNYGHSPANFVGYSDNTIKLDSYASHNDLLHYPDNHQQQYPQQAAPSIPR